MNPRVDSFRYNVFHVPVRNAEREPICFVCETPVERPGVTCSRACYAHFLMAVTSQAGNVEMEELVDLQDMPWYGETIPLDRSEG
jgi:hypothetical protein